LWFIGSGDEAPHHNEMAGMIYSERVGCKRFRCGPVRVKEVGNKKERVIKKERIMKKRADNEKKSG
jgi:hypothetical protein